METVMEAVVRNVEESLHAGVAVLLPDGERLKVAAAGTGVVPGEKELAVADWAFRNRRPAGRGTETLGSAEFLHLPLQASGGVQGILGVKLEKEAGYRIPQIRRLIDAFAGQTAMAMERIMLSRKAEEAQLLEARENLERALLNSISHDLRTPLVSIIGALDILREEGHELAEGSRRQILDTASEEAGRLNRFMGNLLDITRLEAGAVRLKEEPWDIQDLIGCAIAAIEQRLGSRKVVVRLQPELPFVSMDMALMTQVLVNLFDNALKYSTLDSDIEFSAGVEGSLLVLEVADHGPGVPEEDLKRIFEKFYRIQVPEGVRGTGLGLSICKGIAEAHGGGIRAENRLGGGLRVIVTLPLR
jgi:two-component system sensor histidine kinase KdpD